MTKMYLILNVVGWAWFLVVALFLVFRLVVKRKPLRGFDVVSVDTREGADTASGGRDAERGE